MDNLPSTAMGALRLLAATQTEVDIFSDQVIESVKNGEVNPLEVLVYLKAFEKISERVIKETKEHQIKEAGLWGEQTFNKYGADISKCSVKTTYDYTGCNDREWNRWSKEAAELDVKIKKREAFLKSLTKPENTFDEDTGEAWQIHPPIKKEVLGLKVFIK